MIKKILLDYVMGKYRKYILILLLLIFIVCLIMKFFFIPERLDIEEVILMVLGYLVFFSVINNASMPGFPKIDHDSNMFFIFMRIFQLVLVLGLIIKLMYDMLFDY